VKQGQKIRIADFAHDRLFRLTVALLVLIFVLVVLYPLRASGDVALYVDIGGRVLDGQRPYIDFFDVNPPTIHFLNAFPVVISRLTGLHPIMIFHLFVWLLAIGTALSVGYVLTRARETGQLAVLPPWLIPMLIVLGSYRAWVIVTYGQRDHIFILALLAWSVLRWYRWEGGQPRAWVALLVGIFAVIGASLKPSFALAFVLVEGFGLLHYRRWKALFTWEMYGVALIAGLFGAYFITQPDVLRTYLTDIAPSVVTGYSGYGYRSPAALVFGDFQSVVMVCFVLALAVLGSRSRNAQGRLFFLLAIVGLGAVLSFALQTKGWVSHALPMLSMIILIGGLLIERSLSMLRLNRLVMRSGILRAGGVAMIAVCAIIGIIMGYTNRYGEVREQELEVYERYSMPGDRVIAVDMEVFPVYPAVVQVERRPVGRYPMAFPLAFAYADLGSTDVYSATSTPPTMVQTYLERLVEDIRQQQPQLVLLRATPCSLCVIDLDLARYVEAHTDIEALLERDFNHEEFMFPYEVYTRKQGA